MNFEEIRKRVLNLRNVGNSLSFGEFIKPDDKLLSISNIKLHINRYAFALPYIRHKVVLDVACGTGYGSQFLFRKGASKVIGGDISREAIKYAGEFFRGPDYILLDVTNLPFRDKSFDIIVSIETIEHLNDYNRFLSECYRCLKGEGSFICSTPNKEVTSPKTEKPSWRYHPHEFSASELRDAINTYFDDIRIYGYDFTSNSKKIKLLSKLAIFLKPKIYFIPRIDKLINFVGKFVFQGYRVTKLEQVDLDSLLDERYCPVLLEKNMPRPPGHVISIARKSNK